MKRPRMANLLLALSAAGLVLALLSWAVSFFTSPGPPLLTENEKIYRPSEIPGLPHEHIPGGRGQIVGKDTEINSLGFRDPEFSPVKAPGTLRVVVLGNSVVFGQGVEEPDTLPAQLAAFLKEKGITAIAPKPELKGIPAGDLVVSPGDFHPNARSLGIFARLLAEAITRPG